MGVGGGWNGGCWKELADVDDGDGGQRVLAETRARSVAACDRMEGAMGGKMGMMEGVADRRRGRSYWSVCAGRRWLWWIGRMRRRWRVRMGAGLDGRSVQMVRGRRAAGQRVEMAEGVMLPSGHLDLGRGDSRRSWMEDHAAVLDRAVDVLDRWVRDGGRWPSSEMKEQMVAVGGGCREASDLARAEGAVWIEDGHWLGRAYRTPADGCCRMRDEGRSKGSGVGCR
ncbi:hypothetical protein ACLOJK_008825 [Asimina triloba]